VKTVLHVKRHFHYGACNEPVMTSEKKFEIEFFTTLLDTALMPIKERSEQFHQRSETWRFLYKISESPKKKSI
jgi:hypothetical protein